MESSSSSAPFTNVWDKELNINEHYYDVYEKMKSLSSRWKQIAFSWRIRIDTIKTIEANHRGDAEACLQNVIDHWLRKDYDYERYGGPCWRMVCVAVKEGGGDPALANEIAREHPLPATTGGATPHPLPATTGGATPHPLPATTGGATPHPLPATTGGATPHPLPATTGGATPHPLPATTGGAAPHPLPATTGGATPHPLPATTGGATPHPLPATTGGAAPHPLPATTGGATPHPLPATTGGATPHPLPATTGGATPHPLPATTGGATPHPLPATTGGATPHPLPATTGGATPHPLPATTGGAAPHPLPATTGGATPHPLPATTGGATPHPLPATTGGATPHPLPATTGGATPHPLPATTGGATPHPLPATTGGATPHPLPATTGGATPYSMGGPTDGIHNDGMSPLGGGNSSDNERLLIDRRDASPNDDSMSPGSEKSRGTIYTHCPEINFPLASKIHELKDEFADALQLTMKSFVNEPVVLAEIIDYLNFHLHALLGPNRSNNPAIKQAVREEFSDIKTMKYLFIILQNKYISWFNYELILKLVCVHLSDNRTLKRTWSSYEEKLKDYFINSGGLLKDADAVQFGVKGVPPGTRVMIAKVDRDDYTPDHLFFLRRAIPKELGVSEMRFYFSFVTPGSLQFKHLIPEYLYSLLFPLTTELQQQLASIGITELTCGKDKYDLREFSIEEVKHSSTDIDICDPLWYENTSTPLHEAAWRGLKNEVQWLLNKFGYSTYHRGLHGWTPLHSASYGGHIEILRLLIHQYGIDPNEGDDNSVSSIHMASYKGHLSIVQYLVDTCDVPPDQPDNSNNTALLYSAMGGHSNLVEFFIERNCNTSQINCEGASLSLLACQSGELALVHKLESLNLFSPDSKDLYQSGILHYSSISNNVELFKYLLNQYQLPIDVKDQQSRTPLHIASWYASSSVVEYIVSIQGNEALLVNDDSGWSCLHHACYAAMHIPAGIVYSKLYAQSDASVIDIINRTRIKSNIDFIKRNERVKMFSSLLKKASTCPNFDINATTNDGRSLLHLASKSGSTLLVKALEEYNINCTLDNDGRSPVHYAAQSGSTSLLSYIISQYNLNANDTDTYGRTPLVYSCGSGSINSVKYLINNHNSDPNITENVGMTCLHCSCFHGHIDITQYLIEVQHCNINKTDNEGCTLVHRAAQNGNFDLVQYLITEQGLSPTAVTKNGLTALHYVSRSLNLSLVKELITTYQLDPHQADSNGKLLIHYAAQSGDILLLELYMKDYKCSLSLTDKDSNSVIHFSSMYGHTHFIKHLVENHQLDLCAVNDEGMAPIHLACGKGRLNLIQYIIEHIPSSLELPHSKYGHTPLLVAVYFNQLEVIKYLISKKCNLSATDDEGSGAVHISVERGHLNVLKYLIDNNYCNPNTTDHQDRTPLHVAVAANEYEILEYLLMFIRQSS
uniref:Uncharacterized protein n=1 Tax=Amphimedon queenslandica TaxID=400682 RepID=A0A1X7T0X9_AMPQE